MVADDVSSSPYRYEGDGDGLEWMDSGLRGCRYPIQTDRRPAEIDGPADVLRRRETPVVKIRIGLDAFDPDNRSRRSGRRHRIWPGC